MGGSSESFTLGGLTVAVVDDDPGVRSLISRALRSCLAVEVVQGRDGQDAIRLRFAAPSPIAVVINGHMPGMDGIAAIAEIRRREAAEGRSRVLLVYESGDCSSLAEARQRGADAAMATPFDLEVLCALIRSAVRGEGEPQPQAGPVASRLPDALDAELDAAGDIRRRAAEIALRLGSSHVGSEHVAMAAVDGPGGLADLSGLSAAELAQALATPCGHHPTAYFATPRASRLAETAVRLAEIRGHPAPDASDLVMALLNEPGCVAWQSLAAVGVTERGIEQEVRRRAGPAQPPAPQPDLREAASRAWLRANHQSDSDW